MSYNRPLCHMTVRSGGKDGELNAFWYCVGVGGSVAGVGVSCESIMEENVQHKTSGRM